MSGGFGNWNYDQKGGIGGGSDLESGGGGGETASFLGAMPEGMSWGNFKSSLEAQMPQVSLSFVLNGYGTGTIFLYFEITCLISHAFGFSTRSFRRSYICRR